MSDSSSGFISEDEGETSENKAELRKTNRGTDQVAGDGDDTCFEPGDFVDCKARSPDRSAWAWFPMVVTKREGSGRLCHYTCKCPGGTVEEEYSAAMVRRCEDYDWLKDLVIHPLKVGDRVLARWNHKFSQRKWFPGRITQVVPDDTAHYGAKYDVQYDDGDFEQNVDRRNVKAKESRNGDPCSVYVSALA